MASKLPKRRKTDDDIVKDYFQGSRVCDISKSLVITKMFETSTASGALMIMGYLNIPGISTVQKVVFKISFDGKEMDNSAEVEREIYSTIINKFIINNNTPCVPKFIATYKCKAADFKFSGGTPALYSMYVSKKGSYANDIKILVTEDLGEINLDSVNLEEMTFAESVYLIFMLLYTLMAFNRMMLNHNDIRGGNIMIIDTGEKMYKFSPNGAESLSFVTRYLPKIFDFDRSSIYFPGIQRNMGIDADYCLGIGQCNQFTGRNDLFSLIYILHRAMPTNDAVLFLVKNTGYAQLRKMNDPLNEFPNLLHDSLYHDSLKIMISVRKTIEIFTTQFSSLFTVDDIKGAYVSPQYRTIIYSMPTNNKISTPLDIESLNIRAKQVTNFNLEVQTFFESFYWETSSTIFRHYFKLWKNEAENIVYQRNKKIVKYPVVMLDAVKTIIESTMISKRITSISSYILHIYIAAAFYLALPFSNQIEIKYLYRVLKTVFVSPVLRIDMLEKIISDIWNANDGSLNILIPNIG